MIKRWESPNMPKQACFVETPDIYVTGLRKYWVTNLHESCNKWRQPDPFPAHIKEACSNDLFLHQFPLGGEGESLADLRQGGGQTMGSELVTFEYALSWLSRTSNLERSLSSSMSACQLFSDASWVDVRRRCKPASFCSSICSLCNASYTEKKKRGDIQDKVF